MNENNKNVFNPIWVLGEKKSNSVQSNRGIILAAQAGIGTNLDQDCTAVMPSTGSN